MADERPLLREHVYSRLLDAIVRGDLVPGAQLKDDALSKDFGTSRTPVREALLRLERAGLVYTVPGKATVVAPEDPRRVRWTQQVTAELQALAVTLCDPKTIAGEVAAGAATPAPDAGDDTDGSGDSGRSSLGSTSGEADGLPDSPLGKTELGWMKTANASLQLALEAGDAQAAIQADADFHAVVVQACGNPVIGEQLDEISAQLRRAEYLHFGTLTGKDSPKQHHEILKALKKGKYGKAARLTRKNWLRVV